MQPYILRLIYSVFMRWTLKLFIGVKFDDGSFLKKETQYIIVANHNSHLDTMALMAAVPASQIHNVKPVAAEDYFGNTPFKAKMSNYFINTLLISRSGGTAIKQMKKALDDGYSLILFPEGTRGIPDEEQELKPGVALLLSLCPHVKYVPAYMVGMGKAMPKGDGLIVPYESNLYFGKPALVQSADVKEILKQVDRDLHELKASKAGK